MVLDPYLLSLDVLVERFCFDIGKRAGGGVIVAEKRDPTLDGQLDLAWLNLKIQGTRFIQTNHIDERILGLNLRAKRDNISGLQLADLVVSPIGRHVLNKPDREDWRIAAEKFRCSPSSGGVRSGRAAEMKRGQPPLRSDQPTDELREGGA